MKVKKSPIYAIVMVLALLCVVSCNKKDKEEDSQVIYESISTSTVMVDEFNLVANSDVMEHLDSVFFTIDLKNFTIYNADSLPVGTDVSALRVNVTFDSAVSDAEFTITGGKSKKDTTFTYTNTETAIDFTGDVRLKVTSLDKTLTKTYTVKVNVHKMKPDSLYWNPAFRRDLPGAGNVVTAQKMVQTSDGFFHLVATDGKYMMAVSDNIGSNSWDVREISFPMEPVVETFTATDDALYVIMNNGDLYENTDGATWHACGVKWGWILGAYDNRVLGVTQTDGVYMHDEYPRRAGFEPKAIAADFPIAYSSPMIYTSNDWQISRLGMIAGGLLSSDKPCGCIWGYDGNVWGRISDTRLTPVLPAVNAPTLFAYKSFDTNTLTFRISEHPTLFVMGGAKADGSLSGATYVSLDHGILWAEGSDLVQQPAYIPFFSGAQAFVVNERLRYFGVDEHGASSEIVRAEWDCPYIYLVGGRDANGRVNNSIWRGAINRLTFVPLF